MKYSVEYLNDQKVVSIKINGRLNFKSAEQYSKEAVKLAHLNDCNKFLFNHTETLFNGDGMNLHATGDELQQFGFKSDDHVAIIFVKNNQRSDLLKSESINGDWCKFKYFEGTNLEKAFEWLGNV